MVPESLRQLPNPYYITTRLGTKQFVGRENEIEKFKNILEQYRKTTKSKNIIISGNKSIGKSTLLNRFTQLLEDYNFVVYEVDIGRDPSIKINEFEFFKDLINELFEKYGQPDGDFFDIEQCDIWFSLTSNKFEHKSDFKDRKIRFASQYANYKKGLAEKISIKSIEKDFEEILGQIISEEMDSQGLAILIDEFQELSRNVGLLDILRQLSERLTGLMIIGSGLPTFLDNAIFEKFMRTSEPMNLKPMNRSEIFDLIYKPLEEHYPHTRFEMRHWFDFESTIRIIERSGGNPLHVKILCQKMIDYYQAKPELKVIELNRTVMEEVMAYYSNISEKSRTIKLSLQSCSNDQLKAFSLIYRYEGFSLRAAILLELAFNPISIEEEERIKNRLIDNFRDIWDLKLFVFKDRTLRISDIEGMTPNALANIEYEFIGDAIDKLYASYFYKGLTGKDLISYDDKSFEDALVSRVAGNLHSILTDENIPAENIDRDLLIKRIDSRLESHDNYVSDFIKDLDRLKNTSLEEIDKDTTKKALLEISKKHDLSYPAFFAHLMESEGYLLIIAEVTARGKDKLIFDYFPVIRKFDQINGIYKGRKSISINNSILNQYVVNINSICIYWLPKESLVSIRLIDLKEDYRLLVETVGIRNFGLAVEIAARMWGLDLKLSKGRLSFPAESFNNFGFCLINIGDIPKARNVFEKCVDKLLISNVNMAYTYYVENNFGEAKNYLRKIVRKQAGKTDTGRFLHLAINHSKLPTSNRIVEHVSYFNVAAWNMALINCQEKNDQGVVFSYMKKIVAKENEKLIDRRVRYWIDYYKGNLPVAIEKAKALKTDCKGIDYLHQDVCKDIEIFNAERIISEHQQVTMFQPE